MRRSPSLRRAWSIRKPKQRNLFRPIIGPRGRKGRRSFMQPGYTCPAWKYSPPIEPQPAEPAIRQIEIDFLAQPALRANDRDAQEMGLA